MKRIAIYLTAVVAALVPAALGLWGNASFARGVSHDLAGPAVVASHAGADDAARHAAGQGRHHARAHAHAKPHHAEVGDDHGQHAEAGDDHGQHHGGDDKGSGGHGSDD